MELKIKSTVVPMYPVESSDISYIGYSENRLYIIFKKSGLYEFLNVPRETYEQMLISDSKGSFFFRNIRPLYKGIKIEKE